MTKLKSDEQKATRTHAVALPKSVKIQAALGRLRGYSRKSFTRPMAEGEANYQEWRRAGFKGAWWWQYFKGQDAT